jgi:hypothetical protein
MGAVFSPNAHCLAYPKIIQGGPMRFHNRTFKQVFTAAACIVLAASFLQAQRLTGR